MGYLLTFDVGTTAMKCTLFDSGLNALFLDRREYTLRTPAPGVVEMPVQYYWQAFCDSVKKLIEKGFDPKKIRTLTFTTQGETLIAVNGEGVALRPAIVWLDERAKAEGKELASRFSESGIYSHTGVPEMTGAVPAAKLLWLRRHEPEVFNSAAKFLLLEDYFIFRLTEKYVSNYSLLSSTGYFDITTDDYWQEMLEACGISRTKLPKPMPCGEQVGSVSARAEEETGLSKHTIVTTGAMDQVAAAVGAGNTEEGIVTETTGTALAVGATVRYPDLTNQNRITVYRHYDDKFFYMPFCGTAGIVLKWFKDNILPDVAAKAKKIGVSPYRLIDELAASAPPGSGGVIMLPHFLGVDGGAFLGLRLSTTRAELARAVLEGVAAQLKDMLEMLEKTGLAISEIRSGGGGSSDLWCEIKAGICGLPVIKTDCSETTSLGAARLAAQAIGLEILGGGTGFARASKIFNPSESDEPAYREFYKRYKSIGG